MPNWTSNYLTISGTPDKVIAFLNKGLRNTEHGEVHSADKIPTIPENTLSLRSWLPMPETFHKYDTTNTHAADLIVGEYAYIVNENGVNEKVLVTQEIKDAYTNAEREQLQTYGVIGWYDYNLKTLGCKWDCFIESIINAFTDENGDLVISFWIETPWTGCFDWTEAMAKENPDLLFDHKFCNEGGDGVGCYRVKYDNGGVVVEDDYNECPDGREADPVLKEIFDLDDYYASMDEEQEAEAE